MPIPPQNDFFRPFLDILSNGQNYTRAQIFARLMAHFGIDEQTAATHRGVLNNRVAWCDVYLCKAGWVSKKRHHHDSQQDEFRITSLGIREWRANEKITAGYLQRFYRSKVHRGAGADDSVSEAEHRLVEAFESLPDDFTILHSVRWFAKEQGTVGEVDFLIAHPNYGVLVMEVKGGAINIENGRWYSTNQMGQTYEIKDPCEQAERNRRALSNWLAEDPRTKTVSYALFPAVAVPDSRVIGHIRPDCPEDIFIDMSHLEALEARLLAIFRYWGMRADKRNARMDGKEAVQRLIDLFIPTYSLQPRIADIFARERRKIDALTEQQFVILRALKTRKRAAIVGGAGTGKTMLAMEKAQQLLDANYRVLFLCYNKPLQNWLERAMEHPNLMVATFHGIVGHTCTWAGYQHPYRGNEFFTKAADVLADTLPYLTDEQRFDAIIVDEAQDFDDTWWIPLPDLLRDPEKGVFYVFFDDNQRIYKQISNIPMSEEPFFLNDNCRNTQHIYAQLLPYMQDRYETVCIGPEGRPVEILSADTPQAARKVLRSRLAQLVNEEGLSTEDIILLTPKSQKNSQWKPDEMLGNFILSWNLDTEMNNAIRVASIFAYKGLESAVVILTELDQAREEVRDQLIYVGLSRARHHVIVIGDLPQSASSAHEDS